MISCGIPGTIAALVFKKVGSIVSKGRFAFEVFEPIKEVSEVVDWMKAGARTGTIEHHVHEATVQKIKRSNQG